jgi:hypothetical protein
MPLNAHQSGYRIISLIIRIIIINKNEFSHFQSNNSKIKTKFFSSSSSPFLRGRGKRRKRSQKSQWEHYLTKLLTTDRDSWQGEVPISSASQECNFSMQWPFNHCLHARVMLRAPSALLRSRASGPSSKRALRSCSSSDLDVSYPFPQRDPTSCFFSRNLCRHNDGWEDVDVEGGGGMERISTDLLTARSTVPYCSVLYSTVPYPYCTEIPFFDFFDSRLQSSLSISRQAAMSSASTSCTLWEHEGSRWQQIAWPWAYIPFSFSGAVDSTIIECQTLAWLALRWLAATSELMWWEWFSPAAIGRKIQKNISSRINELWI